MAAAVTEVRMSWDFALPGAFAGGALNAAEALASDPPMDNDAFAAFTSARRVRSGLTSFACPAIPRWPKT